MIHILSIDDSRSVHAFLNSILEPIPSKVTHAYDGLEGLSALRRNADDLPEIVLLDWEMPKLSGVETLKKIREAGISVPVIMLTSKNAPEEIMTALSLGANEYVMKPFTQGILIEKIEAVLGRKLA